MTPTVFLHRVVLNVDAPHQWWRIGYHAVINIAEDDTLDAVAMELAPITDTKAPLQYMVAVHKVTGDNNTVLSYYGNLLQIEGWFESIFGLEITFHFTDEDQLNQMTLAQMRKDLLK